MLNFLNKAVKAILGFFLSPNIIVYGAAAFIIIAILVRLFGDTFYILSDILVAMMVVAALLGIGVAFYNLIRPSDKEKK